MVDANKSLVEAIIEKIVAYASKQLSEKEFSLISKFIRLYYVNMSFEDIRDRSIPDLYGAALSHWNLLFHRKPKELKINVFNPQFEQHGWKSTHTIIQVVSEDMPFLVDSIRMEINRLGLTTHLMINIGALKVSRNKKHEAGDIFAYRAQNGRESSIEAPIYMEIDRQTDATALADIQRNIRRVLRDVRASVEDWAHMQARVKESITELDPSKMVQDASEVNEARAFLEWLLDNHFTLLGFRDYEMVGEGKERALRLIAHSGLGVLRDHTHSKMLRQYSDLPTAARKIALSVEQILIISKTNTVSTVHRPAYTDYIGVKHFDEKGQLIGERRFIGLYTSDVYRCDPRTIPVIRNKIKEVLQRSGLSERGHGGKDLLHILSTLPRDDVFQATTDELFDWGMGILHLQERRQIRLFVREDAYGRFISCLVYVPRENFTTDLSVQIQKILVTAFNGLDVSFATYFSESILARLHYVVRVDPRRPLEYDIKALENQIAEIGVSWEGEFRNAALDYFGEERGNAVFNRYRKAFPAGYREAFEPRQGVFDIEHIEELTQEHPLGMSFYRPLDVTKEVIRFKLFRPNFTIPLSDALPMLENMGLRVIGEQPHELTLLDQRKVWINDFNMTYVKEPTFDVEEVRPLFQEAFEKIWFGQAENDGLNRLVLEAELSWKEVTVFRAYTKYFRQIGIPFSESYIADTLVKNEKIVRLLIELFKCYFDPKRSETSKGQIKQIEQQIEQALEEVAILDEDRILRRYLSLIHATLRTTYFQVDSKGNYKDYLAFKLDSKKIPEMPLPLPQYEIFVYSPRFEGVHLRTAKVARGGIRWSDRREDYRTEVLGLMKAQQVKNAIIVPAGAKGGFVVKRLPADANREEITQEGIACYEGFIRGLLDLTDNLQNGEVAHPEDMVCYDGHDPYLVVAADKGTAAFSDIANRIALEKRFWMGDAFASGGSTGYDHKKMGITARGAWISAERHFQELGINLENAEITVVGIGDMSGDVFGNGMLLSSHVKLVAAFNHQHIFLDPNPSPQAGYQERLRLFNLPRSTWDDYNRSLISKGGGVFSRGAKAIRLSPETQQLLGVDKDVMQPNQLIRAILKAPVDLIWNGGIGTYVKATTETNVEVGDRSTDNVRVNGKELRARVVCEGGNLGCTQLGRIEYQLSGGKINTDFIDNSAGVDCSDHEVNIKILLNSIVAAGDMTEKQRNQLLASMTDGVAESVLENNYDQNEAISLAAHFASRELSLMTRYMEFLEQNGKVDRELEFLPNDKTLLERRALGLGLTRPELSILLAYTKITLKAQIKQSPTIQDPYLSKFVSYAFPKQLRRRFESQMQDHYLAKEIIATQLSNQLVTEMGIPFVYQMQNETGASVSAVVRSYAAATKIFKLSKIRRGIESLDYQVDAGVQYQMNSDVIQLVRRATRWFLRSRREKLDILATIDHFSEHVDALYTRLPKLLLGADKEGMDQRQKELLEKKVPADVAVRIASTIPIYHALNIVEAATTHNEEVFRVAKIYFMLADRMDLFWFRERLNTYPVDSRWAVLARAAYKGELDWVQRELTVRVLLETRSRSIPGKIKEWLGKHDVMIQRWQSILADMRSAETKDFAILFVAIRELFDLAAIHPSETGSKNQ